MTRWSDAGQLVDQERGWDEDSLAALREPDLVSQAIRPVDTRGKPSIEVLMRPPASEWREDVLRGAALRLSAATEVLAGDLPDSEKVAHALAVLRGVEVPVLDLWAVRSGGVVAAADSRRAAAEVATEANVRALSMSHGDVDMAQVVRWVGTAESHAEALSGGVE